MSAKSPEEEAGYVRFTVVLPTDVVRKLDVLKAEAMLDSRNQVISEAIKLLDYVISQMALSTSKEAAEQAIFNYIDATLSKYWLARGIMYNNITRKREPGEA